MRARWKFSEPCGSRGRTSTVCPEGSTARRSRYGSVSTWKRRMNGLIVVIWPAEVHRDGFKYVEEESNPRRGREMAAQADQPSQDMLMTPCPLPEPWTAEHLARYPILHPRPPPPIHTRRNDARNIDLESISILRCTTYPCWKNNEDEKGNAGTHMCCLYSSLDAWTPPIHA